MDVSLFKNVGTFMFFSLELLHVLLHGKILLLLTFRLIGGFGSVGGFGEISFKLV